MCTNWPSFCWSWSCRCHAISLFWQAFRSAGQALTNHAANQPGLMPRTWCAQQILAMVAIWQLLHSSADACQRRRQAELHALISQAKNRSREDLGTLLHHTCTCLFTTPNIIFQILHSTAQISQSHFAPEWLINDFAQSILHLQRRHLSHIHCNNLTRWYKMQQLPWLIEHKITWDCLS